MSSIEVVYQQSGSMIFPTQKTNSPEPLPKLPPANYMVKIHPKLGFYLSQVEGFELPKKMYGDSGTLAARIVNTFQKTSSNLGVMLEGEKGSGKSMTAKAVCLLMQSQDCPTILITNDFISDPYPADAFIEFLSLINQPCVVLMDEFEKVFDADAQRRMLTILDGVFQSRKLFLLTCNVAYRLDTNLHNRPGRLHYWKSYKGLDSEVIREVCKDLLSDQSKTEDVVRVSGVFGGEMNFDMLRALISEVNLYPSIPVVDHLQILNIRPQLASSKVYQVVIEYRGIRFSTPQELQFDNEWSGNPLTLTNARYELGSEKVLAVRELMGAGRPQTQGLTAKSLQIEPPLLSKAMISGAESLASLNPCVAKSTDSQKIIDIGEDDDDLSFSLSFKGDDMKAADIEKGVSKFVNSDGFTLTLTRKEESMHGSEAYLRNPHAYAYSEA